MPPVSREGFTVRVLRSGSATPAGIGFVVGDRHIVTCAHVVNTALSRKQKEQGRPGPDIRVQVDFPILGDAEGAPLRGCRVEAWEPPPKHGVTGGDVAGLVLVGEGLPAGAGPGRLADSASAPGVAVAVFGYPGDPPQRANGAWSTQQMRGLVGGGVIQLDTDGGSAIRAQPGYSGSPAVVTSETGDIVIGMLAVTGRDGDDRDSYAIPVSQLVSAWPDVLADLTMPDCPYRGLRSFTAEDAAAGLFVGRENEVARLRLMVEQRPLVLVTGPSGVGKSSLVSAGLIPALTRDGWATATYRPSGTPFEALAKALLELERPGQMLTLDDLDRLVRELLSSGLDRIGPQLTALKGKVLLFADQLEEILDPVTCPQQKRAAFIELVLRTTLSGQLHMVCALRADFFNQLLEHPGAAAAIQHQLFPMSPMTREQLERIIVEPAHVRDVRYESGLVQLIAREAVSRGCLPMLEFALTELWPHQRRRRITLAEYQGLGGVTGALTHRAEDIYTELAQRCPEDRIRRVLLTMVRSRQGASEATRRVATHEQLGPDWEVAEELAKRRLVVLDHDSARRCDTAELAHEALIQGWPRLFAWVDADAEFQRWLTTMEERASDDLLSEARMGEADRWLAERSDDIPKEVVSLVERSKSDWLRRMAELQEARARAEQAAHRAEKAAQEAEARRLAAAAELAVASGEVSLQVPIALAVESLRTAPLLEGDIAARHAIRTAARHIRRLNHGGTVWAVAFSPDGTQVATGSDDRSARVFDAATGAEISRIDHAGGVRAVAFSPDGRKVMTAGFDRCARVFDPSSGAERCQLDYGGTVLAAAFSPDGTRVATASFDHSARVFDVATGAEISRVDHSATVRAAAFSPDGNLVATASEDGTARVFDATTGAERYRLEHGGTVWAAAFSPDGTRVATASFDHSARVFDVATGAEISHLNHGRPVLAVAFSPDGTRIATASSDGSARVFDADSGAWRSRLDHGGSVQAVAFSPDGGLVATASDDGSARVFDVLTGAGRCRLDHDASVRAVAFSPDGARVVTASDDGSARLFDVAAGAEVSRTDHHGGVRAVALSPDGTLVATASDDGSTRVFHTATGAGQCRLDHDGGVRAVALSPDGTLVATASDDGSTRVFDAATGAEVSRIGHDDPVLGVAFSPDSTLVATASDDGSARVFDAATGAEVSRMDHDDSVLGVAFSPDSTVVATASGDGSARVFDAATGAEVSRMDHDGGVRAVAFSPDGAQVATASDDGSARVFDAATGAGRCRIDHGGPVRAVAFGPDGTRVTTVGDDGSACVWVVDPGQLIKQAESRLIRNLTQQEWRRFFRDEPYRITRADLP